LFSRSRLPIISGTLSKNLLSESGLAGGASAIINSVISGNTSDYLVLTHLARPGPANEVLIIINSAAFGIST
jgi:hypothetical protein